MAREAKARAWAEYVADSVNLAPQGKALGARYSELGAASPHDGRSGAEIAADVVQRAGLEVVSG